MSNTENIAKRSSSTAEPVHKRGTVAPPVDVYENADELLLVADMAGASPEGIEIQLEKGQLTIHAKRSEEGVGTLLAAEFRPQDYYRIFSVPHGIDPSKIDAQVADGVLKLRLPKADAVKPRRIEVRQG